MSDREERDAARLAAFLDGKDGAIPPEEAEVVGLLRHAAGTPTAGGDRLFERIRAAAPARARRTWGWIPGYVAAAAVVVWLLLRPAPPPPLPPGPTVAERKAAFASLDPSYGPPIARLSALNVVAGRERARLVAGVERAP